MLFITHFTTATRELQVVRKRCRNNAPLCDVFHDTRLSTFNMKLNAVIEFIFVSLEVKTNQKSSIQLKNIKRTIFAKLLSLCRRSTNINIYDPTMN
jgi:hypothetical protein